MEVRTWLQKKLRTRTVFDVFNECYNRIYGSCKSNQIVIDTNHYRSCGTIPPYVHRVFELDRPKVMPANAVKSTRWMDTWNHQAYQTVAEPAPLLLARRCPDGVYRCN